MKRTIALFRLLRRKWNHRKAETQAIIVEELDLTDRNHLPYIPGMEEYY